MFGAFRVPPWPTLYAPLRTPVTTDIHIASIVYCIVILLVPLLAVVPGSRKGQKFYSLIRVTVFVFVGGAIMVCNYGQDWEVASIVTTTPYRARISQNINATIQVKIGLRSINITLQGVPRVQHLSGSVEETIDYNERFSWDGEGWVQGVHGLGPLAGRFNQEFRKAQLRGLPYPILWTAEHFTIDGDGIRWGRFYRQAGYFTHMAMWCAFPLWLLTAILFSLVPSYGAFYSILTGLDLFTACFLFAWIRNPHELAVHFEDGRLLFAWGWCYWMTLLTGISCTCFGIMVYLAEMRFPEEVIVFFGHDVTSEYEELYICETEPYDNVSNYESSVCPGRMTSIDCPITHSPSPLEDTLSSSFGPSTDDSFIVSGREEGSDLEDFDTVISEHKEYRQVFRKRTNSALLLWKHTLAWRRQAASPEQAGPNQASSSTNQAILPSMQTTHDYPCNNQNVKGKRPRTPWSGQSPLTHPKLHRRNKARPNLPTIFTSSFTSTISNYSEFCTDNDSPRNKTSSEQCATRGGIENAMFWESGEEDMGSQAWDKEEVCREPPEEVVCYRGLESKHSTALPPLAIPNVIQTDGNL